MEIATLKYLGNLRTVNTHLKSGQEVVTDAPIDNNGKGEAFSPTDLLSTAVAACATTIMGIAANTHSINLDGLTAAVSKTMESNPRRVGAVGVIFTFARNYTPKEKEILERAALTCPVILSLSLEVEKEIEFNYPS